MKEAQFIKYGSLVALLRKLDTLEKELTREFREEWDYARIELNITITKLIKQTKEKIENI